MNWQEPGSGTDTTSYSGLYAFAVLSDSMKNRCVIKYMNWEKHDKGNAVISYSGLLAFRLNSLSLGQICGNGALPLKNVKSAFPQHFRHIAKFLRLGKKMWWKNCLSQK